MNSGWTNKDWKWLTSILIAVIILSFSMWLGDYSINFSIISSSVSIALAIVAISMSMQQNKDNQRTLRTITNMKNEVINHVKDVGVKVDNMPMTDITDIVKNFKESKEVGSEDLKEKDPKVSEVKGNLYKKFLEVNTLNESKRKNKYLLNIQFDRNEELEIISSKISAHLKAENILYNKTNINSYEFAFISELPNLEERVGWIQSLLNEDILGITVLGFFKIG